MKIKIASFISVIGHPLLTIPIYTIIALFTYEAFQTALLQSSLILVGFFLPLTVKMYLKSRNGTYTNFDVSDRTQRQSWYIFAFVLLLIITLVLFVTKQPQTLSLSVLFSLILLGTSQLMNYVIKSSLHVSFNILLSFLILPMNLIAGLIFLVFTALIASARLTLKRHTFKEVIAGSIIGLTVGSSFLLFR